MVDSPGADADFSFHVQTSLDAPTAWRRVVDVSRHGDVVPLTSGTAPDPEVLAVGDRVVARTALGPVGFDDVMVVRELVPAHRVVFEKVGRVLRGVVTVDVAPQDGGATVVWQQSVRFPFLPGALGRGGARVAAPLLRHGYRVTVGRLLAQ